MADFALITLSTDHFKQQDSASITIDFDAIRIGTNELELTDNAGSWDFGDNPIIDVTSIEIGASGLKVSEGTAGNLSVNGVKIEGVATPTAGTDAVNKDYVDGVAQGLDVKHSVKACSSANLSVTASGSGAAKTLTATANGVLTVDGVSTWTDIDNDGASADPFAANPASRVLVFGQTVSADNGIYAVKEKGAGGTAFILIRAEDFDTDSLVTAGAFTFCEEGTVGADVGFVLTTNDPITVDVTGQSWTQFSGAGAFTGGEGITISGTVIEVDLEAAGVGTGGLELSAVGAAGQIRVDAGDGIELNANGVSVDIEAAGSGTGGLAFNGSQELAVDAGDGIELTANGISVDVEAAGSGTGGLAITAGLELAVDAGDGIELNANGVSVDLSGTSGLQITAGELEVDAGDGITLDADGVNIDLLASSGLQLSATDGTGQLSVDLAAAGAGTGGLELVGNEIAADAGDGIELTANGISVDVGEGLTIDGTQQVAVDFSKSLTNGELSAITVRQVVYIDADGTAKLAKNDIASIDDHALGLVEDASIASSAAGEVVLRRGAIVGGFSGLTPGKRQYVSDATAGDLTESLAGFVAGEYVYEVGRACSATQVIFDPRFIVEL